MQNISKAPISSSEIKLSMINIHFVQHPKCNIRQSYSVYISISPLKSCKKIYNKIKWAQQTL